MQGSWFRKVGRALSQVLGAFSGGPSDMTFSARMGYQAAKGEWYGRVGAFLVDLVNLPFEWRMGHCARAYEAHRGRNSVVSG